MPISWLHRRWLRYRGFVTHMKLISTSVFFLLAFIAIAVLSILIITYDVDHFQCDPFEKISKDSALNERLRSELTDFINDEENLHKLDGLTNLGFITRNQYYFDTSFPWTRIFDRYPEHQRHLELALRIDEKMRELTPPYHITEVGLYSARSLLMYTNENPDQYTGGEGAVRLSEKPYVQCQVSFSGGVPVD